MRLKALLSSLYRIFESKRLPTGCMGMVYCFILGLLLGSYGCASAPMGYKPVTLERTKAQLSEETVSARKTGASNDQILTLPAFENTTPEKKLPLRKPVDPKRITQIDHPVMINADQMPLADFVVYALGETLKVSFVMDAATMNNKNPVTLRMPQALPPGQALEIIIGLFEKNGLYVEEEAGALYILSKPPPSKAPMDIRIGRDVVDSSADILQVVPLKYITKYELEPIIKEMFQTGVKVLPYGNRLDIILLYGQAFQVKQIVGLIETFDAPYLQKKVLFLMRLKYWQTEEFIRELTKILEGLGFSVAKISKDPGSFFVPIKKLNSILVVAPDEKMAKYIQEWKEKLDNAEAAGDEEKAYSYVPQYTKASDLVASIKKLYGVLPETAQKTGVAKTAPTAAAGSAVQAATFPDLKISADDNRNIIIIISSPANYRNLLDLLKGLDTPPRQVLIEAMIAELTLTDELQYGVEWFIKDTQQGGQYTLGTLGNLGLKTLGLSYSFLSQTGNFQALISALATRNKVNILSTPRLTVLDNMEATIQVGQDVPTVTSEIASAITATATPTSPTNVLRSIQYRSTGVMLRVKPTINTEGLLTLDISVEVSEIGAAGVSDSPIILARKLNTSVVVAHGQTIALGGLMKDNVSLVETKVPLLGDIPLLGNLFKYTDKKKEKTELLVLVTPTILIRTDDAVKITDELRKELRWLRSPGEK